MHIVFLDSTAQMGGAERVLLDLMAGLRSMRPDWELTLCAPDDGPLTERARDLDVRTCIVPFPRSLRAAGDYGLRLSTAAAAVPGAASYLVKLRGVLKSLKPHVIHTNGFKQHVAVAWAKPAESRLIWHLHDYVSRRSRSAALLRRSAGACTAIVANSQSVADDAQRVLKGSVTPVAILNGVDLSVFTPDGPMADLDSLAGLPPAPAGIVRVGLVATYAKWKGHGTFMKALAALPPGTPVRGYIIGGPIYQTAGSQHTREELEGEAVRLGLQNRLGLIGFVSDTASIYRALDVVVHASTEPEPFGLVIAEAMACGRAVIAANAGGVPEIVHARTDALLHQPGNAADLAAAIRSLARDGDLRRPLGQEARRTAEVRLSTCRLVREFCGVYEGTAPQTTRRQEAVVRA